MQSDPGQERLAGDRIAVFGLVQVPEEHSARHAAVVAQKPGPGPGSYTGSWTGTPTGSVYPARRMPFGTTTMPFGLTKKRFLSSSAS